MIALRILATPTCLGGWVAGWLFVTASIVSKRLNLSLKLFRPFDTPIIEAFGTPYANTKFQGEPTQRGI